jgi:hypothetical protein
MGHWDGFIGHWASGMGHLGQTALGNFDTQWVSFLLSGRKHIYKTGLKPGICKNHSFGYS